MVLLLCLTLLAQGQEATLTLTVPAEPVTNGSPLVVWLNAMNASSNAISWTFPPQLEARIISPQGTNLLELRSAGSNAVVLAPGGFVREEYAATVPAAVTGRVLLEFPGLAINRTVLDVQTPGAQSAKKEKKSFFNRYVKEAEAGKGSEPGRFFKEHISGYEPMYFLVSPESLNAKFQLSFAYQLLNNDGPLATAAPVLKGFHVAYTQTSLWDGGAASTPFYDTSYKPEFFFALENVTGAAPMNWFQLDLQVSLKHESNGKGGVDSRSVNLAYFRPTLTLGRDDGLQFTLRPRVWAYLGEVEDNPDIVDYRGYGDLQAILGWKRGLQLSAWGRTGTSGKYQSVQLDLTYPTMRLFGSFSLYLHVQYFTGYGESLLGYNQKSDELRVGFALFR